MAEENPTPIAAAMRNIFANPLNQPFTWRWMAESKSSAQKFWLNVVQTARTKNRLAWTRLDLMLADFRDSFSLPKYWDIRFCSRVPSTSSLFTNGPVILCADTCRGWCAKHTPVITIHNSWQLHMNVSDASTICDSSATTGFGQILSTELMMYVQAPKKINPCVIPNSFLRSWNVFVPEPSGTLFAMCTGTFQNLIRYLPRNPRNLISFLVRNPPEPRQPSVPDPAGTASAICTGTIRNHPEPYTGTIRNLISHLHRNRPEPHQLSAPEPSGTSSAFCTGTLRNLLRNLGLQLHRIAPKLFWAKDPIASFAVGEFVTPIVDSFRPFQSTPPNCQVTIGTKRRLTWSGTVSRSTCKVSSGCRSKMVETSAGCGRNRFAIRNWSFVFLVDGFNLFQPAGVTAPCLKPTQWTAFSPQRLVKFRRGNYNSPANFKVESFCQLS